MVNSISQQNVSEPLVTEQIISEQSVNESIASSTAPKSHITMAGEIIKSLETLKSESKQVIDWSAISEKDMDMLKGEIARVVSQRGDQLSSLDANILEIEERKKQADMEIEKHDTMVKDIGELQLQLKELNDDKEALTTTISEKSESFDKLTASTVALKSTVKELTKSLDDKSTELDETKGLAVKLEKLYKESVSSVAKKTRELEKVKAKGSDLTEKLNKLNTQLGEKNIKKVDIDSNLDVLRSELEKVTADNKELLATIKSNKETVSTLKLDVKGLKKEISQADKSHSDTMKTVEEENKKLADEHSLELKEFGRIIEEKNSQIDSMKGEIDEKGAIMDEKHAAILDLEQKIQVIETKTGDKTDLEVAEKSAMEATILELQTLTQNAIQDTKTMESNVASIERDRDATTALMGEMNVKYDLDRQKIENGLKAKEEEMQRTEARVLTLESIIASNNLTRSSLEKTVEGQGKELTRIKTELKAAEILSNESSKTRQLLETRIQTSEKDFIKMTNSIAAREQEIADSLEKIRNQEKEIAFRDIQLEKQKGQLEQISEEKNGTVQKLEKLEVDINTLMASESSKQQSICDLQEQIQQKDVEILSQNNMIDQQKLSIEEKNRLYGSQHEIVADLVRELEATNFTLKEKESQIMMGREEIVAQMKQMTDLTQKHSSILKDLTDMTRMEGEIKHEIKDEINNDLKSFVKSISDVRDALCQKLENAYDDEKLSLLSKFEGKAEMIELRMSEIDLLETDIKSRTAKFEFIDKYLVERQGILDGQVSFIEQQQSVLLTRKEQVADVNASLDEYAKLMNNKASYKTVLAELKKKNLDQKELAKDMENSCQELNKLKGKFEKTNVGRLEERIDKMEKITNVLYGLLGCQVTYGLAKWVFF